MDCTTAGEGWEEPMKRSIKAWLYRHGYHIHAQNLHRDGAGQMWREGRAWFYRFVGDGDKGTDWAKKWEIHAEWLAGNRHHVGLSIQIGDHDDDVLLHVGVPFVSVWFGIDPCPALTRLLPRTLRHVGAKSYWHTDPREISVRLFDGALWWLFWMDSGVSSSTDPRWRRGTFRPVDVVLGKDQFSKRDVSTHRVLVPMPEKVYEGTVTMFLSAWKRSRWPWPRQMLRATLVMDDPVPFPGKGENSWDVDDDAIYEITTPATSPLDAVAALVASVERCRRQYGGKDWHPAVPA